MRCGNKIGSPARGSSGGFLATSGPSVNNSSIKAVMTSGCFAQVGHPHRFYGMPMTALLQSLAQRW